MNKNRIRQISFMGLYIAVAFIFSYIESLFPLPIPFPGIKLGLANLIIVFVLYSEGIISAFIVSMLRNVLNALTFGSLFGLFYSLAGSILSLLIMWLLSRIIIRSSKKSEHPKPLFSVISISCIGGVCHNIGQFLIAILLVGYDAILYYLPFLYFAGLIAGILIGIVTQLCLRKLTVLRFH